MCDPYLHIFYRQRKIMKNYLLNLLLISCLFSSCLVAAPKSVTLKSGIDAISVEGKDYFIAGKVRFYEGNSIVKGDINLDYEEYNTPQKLDQCLR
jgi:hypothetical protein